MFSLRKLFFDVGGWVGRPVVVQGPKPAPGVSKLWPVEDVLPRAEGIHRAGVCRWCRHVTGAAANGL